MEHFFGSVHVISDISGLGLLPSGDSVKYEYGFCRLCATRVHSEMLCSFSVMNSRSDMILARMSKLNIGIRRGDGLPQVVCQHCLQQLEVVNNFIQNASSAQTVLMAMFAPDQLQPDKQVNTGGDYGDSSCRKDIFGCRKIKIEKTRCRRTSASKLKADTLVEVFSSHIPKKSSVEIPEPRSVKVPQISDDVNIKRWSDFFCCKRCEFCCESIQELRQHSWDTHTRCIVFKCVECFGRISTYKRFLRHMIKHHKTLQQCCEFCNKTFSSEWDNILHKNMEHSIENRQHKCNNCGCTFNNLNELQNHQDAYCIIRSKRKGRERKQNIKQSVQCSAKNF